MNKESLFERIRNNEKVSFEEYFEYLRLSRNPSEMSLALDMYQRYLSRCPDNKIDKKVVDTVDESNFRTFVSGAKRSRDADHARFDLLPYKALDQIAAVLKTGAEKYGAANWKKGLGINVCLNHLLQHIYKYIEGDRSEPHLAHAACNILFCLHYAAGGEEYDANHEA